MKPIEEMTGLELREAVAVEIIGVRIRKQRGARSHLRDLVIPGGVDGIDFVQEEGEPELTVHTLIKGVPAYESSIEAAFQVVEKMREKGWLVDIHGHQAPWSVNFWKDSGREISDEHDGLVGDGADSDSLPLAIARASLKAVRAK